MSAEWVRDGILDMVTDIDVVSVSVSDGDASAVRRWVTVDDSPLLL